MNKTIEYYSSAKGCIEYLDHIIKQLEVENDQPLSNEQIAFLTVLRTSKNNHLLLDYYKDKYGKIDIKDFNKWCEKQHDNPTNN